jgi:hypothetical protein
MEESTERIDAEKDETPEDPFVAGSHYRVRSLGTQKEPFVSEGEFLGFTSFGMGGQGMRLKLADSHGEDAGRVRVIPLHMIMHVDILSQKSPESKKKDDEHHSVFYT